MLVLYWLLALTPVLTICSVPMLRWIKLLIFTAHANTIEQMRHSTVNLSYYRTRQAFSSLVCLHIRTHEWGMCTNALNRHRNTNYMLAGERCLSLSIEIISHMAIITEAAPSHSAGLTIREWNHSSPSTKSKLISILRLRSVSYHCLPTIIYIRGNSEAFILQCGTIQISYWEWNVFMMLR